jgi:hypothetical protein
MRETRLPDGVLVEPADPNAALVVISGSSGRLEVERARVLARHGIAAFAFHWYDGMPAPLADLPLETFMAALDRIRPLAPSTGILGTSFGAEVSLLLAANAVPLDLVVALAPTSVAWQSPLRDDDGRPVGVNKWSWAGRSVPGVPYLDQTKWTGAPVECARDVHVLSLAASAGDSEDVAIKVEAITADLVVSSGGADTVWQAEAFCHDIVRRRTQHGLATTHVHHPEAGHRAVLPGESPPTLRLDMPRSSGTAEANEAHGEQVLSAILGRIALATEAT